MERVPRIADVQLIFLVPGIKGVEIQDHIPGQVRRGSQTSMALALSRTVAPPRTARMRLAVGSYRTWPNPLASKLRI